jgi:nitrogen fixation NifU-like protein
VDATGFSSEVLEHFRNPVNPGSFPRETPGLVSGEAGDPAEGRLVVLQLVLRPDGRIGDARFRAFGCPATIAAASFVVSRVAGRPQSEARALDAAAISEALALSDLRRPAAELANSALHNALAAEP